MSKNIVVLSDGTGQIGGRGHDTNIYKLFRMLEDRTERQIVFYDEGLGTDWRKVTGNAFGAGLSKNLLQCYKFIYDHYQAGDRIYLFGFSRGAATVRSLASFIHFFGILPRSRPGLIKEAYNLYRKGREKPTTALIDQADAIRDALKNQVDALYQSSRQQAARMFKRGGDSKPIVKSTQGSADEDRDTWEEKLNKKATEFIHLHPNQWANIEFLGVWDTVPAIGVVALAGLNSFLGRTLKYNFHDFKLHPSVKNAYHALAIDDERLWFHPSLWTEKSRPDQIVEQVWFGGAHTDVGGGFVEAGLSDITLEWMLEKAVSHGLRIYLGSRKYWNFVVAPDPTDEYHDPRSGFGRIYAKKDRDGVWFSQGESVTADAAFGPPVIHESVLERLNKLSNANGTGRWFLSKNINSEHPEFRNFLRRKYYDHLRFEWNKINSWAEIRSWTEEPVNFDDWLKQSHPEYWGSGEAAFHSQYLMSPYKDWIKAEGGAADWLETEYQAFKDWRERRVRQFSGDGKFYFVEPYRKLEDISFLKPLQDMLVLNAAELEGSLELILKGYPKFATSFLTEKLREIRRQFPKLLRDYDQERVSTFLKKPDGGSFSSVQEIGIRYLLQKRGRIVKISIDEAASSNIPSEFLDLLRRGSTDRSDRNDRIGHDLKRWGK